MSTSKITSASMLGRLSDNNLKEILDKTYAYDAGQLEEFSEFFRKKDDISENIILLGLEHPELWEGILGSTMFMHERNERFMRAAFLPKIRLMLYSHHTETRPFIKKLIRSLLNHAHDNTVRFFSLMEIWQMAHEHCYGGLDEILPLVLNHTHFKRDVLRHIISQDSVQGAVKDGKALWVVIKMLRK